MYKLASLKQINYLNHILESENIELSNLTSKEINELTHYDICQIFKKFNLENIFTPCFNNKKYIIEKKTNDYIIGKQICYNKNETIIYNLISFKNLLVLDWDCNDKFKNKIDLLSFIKCLLSKYPYTFLLYETFNGFHAYCISHKFNYKEYKTLKLMKLLNCDNSYISYTKKVGFVVRLNKKQNRNEEFIEKYVCQINDYKIDENLKFLVELKDKFTC